MDQPPDYTATTDDATTDDTDSDDESTPRSVLDEALGPQLVDALAAASRRYDVMITISVTPFERNETTDRDPDY